MREQSMSPAGLRRRSLIVVLLVALLSVGSRAFRIPPSRSASTLSPHRDGPDDVDNRLTATIYDDAAAGASRRDPSENDNEIADVVGNGSVGNDVTADNEEPEMVDVDAERTEDEGNVLNEQLQKFLAVGSRRKGVGVASGYALHDKRKSPSVEKVEDSEEEESNGMRRRKGPTVSLAEIERRLRQYQAQRIAEEVRRLRSRSQVRQQKKKQRQRQRNGARRTTAGRSGDDDELPRKNAHRGADPTHRRRGGGGGRRKQGGLQQEAAGSSRRERMQPSSTSRVVVVDWPEENNGPVLLNEVPQMTS